MIGWIDKIDCDCIQCEAGLSMPFNKIDFENDLDIIKGAAEGRILNDAFDVDFKIYYSGVIGDSESVVRVQYGDEVTYVLIP